MSKPSPDAIVNRSPGIPQYEGDEKSVVQRFFAGRDWRDMTHRAMREGLTTPEDAALTFMVPEAFRYFLPAYMLVALEEYDISDITGDAAVLGLIPDLSELTGNASNPESWFSRNIRGFNGAQRQAIAGFLLAMQEVHGHEYPQHSSPMAALERYWARFLPEEDRSLVGRVKGRDIPADAGQRVREAYYAKLKETDAT